jgi:2-oxoglutarate ferredoxin oxidoreductase subunit alpha
VKQARDAGIKAGSLKFVTVWPFPEKRVTELATKAKAFVVPEMNFGQIVLEVERNSYGKANIFFVAHGEKGVEHSEDILAAIQKAAQTTEVKTGIIEVT